MKLRLQYLWEHGLASGLAGVLVFGTVINAKSASAQEELPAAITLSSGRTVRGTLGSKAIMLRTAYGDLEIEAQWITIIDLVSLPAGLTRVTTVNSNVLTGFLTTHSFRLDTNRNGGLELNRWQIEKIVFPPGPARSTSLSRWFRLRNGDILSGMMREHEFALASTEGEKRFSATNVVQWASAGSSGEIEVTTADGKTARGTLRPTKLDVELEWGSKITLECSEVLSIRPNRSNAVQVAIPPDKTLLSSSPNPSITNSFPNLVWLPPGEVLIGSPPEELGHDSDETPATRVVIPHGFFISKHEVTQREYQALIGANPSLNSGEATRPVERVTWFEAMTYCELLTRKATAAEQLPPGWAFRLPTEAEWEYACRAGTTTRFSYGDDPTDLHLGTYAWFTRNSDSMTHPVGTKAANPWGLYDMHGNVWEWCLDRWGGSLPGGTMTNITTAASGTLRAARGGSWLYEARACRSANRDDYAASNRCGDVGFRVVLAPIGQP